MKRLVPWKPCVSIRSDRENDYTYRDWVVLGQTPVGPSILEIGNLRDVTVQARSLFTKLVQHNVAQADVAMQIASRAKLVQYCETEISKIHDDKAVYDALKMS